MVEPVAEVAAVDPLRSSQRIVEQLETKVAVLQAEVLKQSLKVRCVRQLGGSSVHGVS